MGKVKAKRRNLSENASMKESIPKKKPNPFEMHINRQKYEVIGRKLKSERGRPGISRSRAMKKRKATLLQEYKVKDKSNKFFDRRIGEKNSAMTHEDKVMARFTKERVKMFNKKQMYNLADDEILTHRGQTLSEIEKFDDPRSDDDDDVDDTGKLSADFVEDAHFGGGMFKKSEGEKRSRNDLIEQLIAESKKRKAEKQRSREQTLELTEKLDTEWQDLLPIVSSSKKKPTDPVEIEKPDAYDTVMRELKFEARGYPSDPLKTEDETQEEEKKKREKLESEREKRMQLDVQENEVFSKHRSADDLDDGFAVDDEPEVFVSYDSEGNLQHQGQSEQKTELERDEVGDSNMMQTSEDCKSEEESDDDDDDDDDNDEDSDDSLSDLKPPSESEREFEQPEAEDELLPEHKNREEIENNQEMLDDSSETLSITAQLPKPLSESEKKTLLQEVKKKFSNFSSVPENYNTFYNVLKSYNAEKQAVIITHMMEKNHVGLNEGNRTQLEQLFSFLLKHLHNSSSQGAVECFKVLNSLTPALYDLVHLSPECTSQCLLEYIKEKQQAYQKHQHKYPTLNTLIFLKVVSLLFPTSDFRHPIVTPSIVFMCEMLFKCRIKSKRDISTGLFLVTLFLEFTVLSKRFSPAAVNFLCGVLHLAIPKTSKNIQNVSSVPPFRKIGPYSDLLVLENKVEEVEEPLQMRLSDLSDEGPIDTGFKIRAFAAALSMFKEFLSNLGDMSASPCIFHHAAVLLTKVPSENYPSRIHAKIEELSGAFQKLNEKNLQYLVIERKRPKALRLYEPHIETVFDAKRRKPMGKEKMERERLLHKIKREHKSAMREIRRDNSFLAKLKYKEAAQSDAERLRKVKEIFGSASAQLGEIRALERTKSYLKKKK